MSEDATQPGRGVRAAVLALFFTSGVSGLIYQVIWVRQFGNVFGNTLHSAALVTGVFMLGLGVGSWAIGRYGDRRFARDPTAPLRSYGWAEIAIAALGVVVALVVPRLSALSATLSSYERGPEGWFELSASAHAFRYAVALALMAPPALLMGGTLTLLIRFMVASDPSSSGWRIGLLYGVNTAGAALGAVLTDTWLVPSFGVTSTQLVAAGGNVLAGTGALWLARAAPTKKAAAGEEAASDAREPAGRRVWLTGAALAMSGFAAMGIEILWFRYLTQVLGATRSVLSLLLCVILVGIWLGATLGGALERRFGHPVSWLIGVNALFVAASLVSLGAFDHHAAFHRHVAEIRPAFVAASDNGRALMGLYANLSPILAVAGVPSLLMGLSFPLANAHVQRTVAVVGARAGSLYLANTLGNVLGSVLVGFVLLPALGIRWTLFALALSAGASAVPLWLSAIRPSEWQNPGRLSHALAASLLVSAVSLYSFQTLPAERLLLPAIPRGNEGGTRGRVEVSEGPNETLAIIEIPGVERALYTNGHPMSSTTAAAQRYMRAFAHFPLLHIDHPSDVLVICFGVGNTLHAASLHPSVSRLEIADLSRHVLDHAQLFEEANHGILRDPRVSVFVNDGRHHLLMQPEGRYDLVTLEPPPIAFAGVAALYSRDFYELVKSRLKPGGFVTQWVPAYQVSRPHLLALVRAFVEVFPATVLLSGHDRELILMGRHGDAPHIEPARWAERLAEAPEVEADLKRIYLGSPVDVFGSFAASARVLQAAVAGADVVTDDRPLLEYAQHIGIVIADIPSSFFDTSSIGEWCTSCLDSIPFLAEYLAAREHVYRSRAFLQGVPDASEDTALPIIAGSEYLQFLAEGPAYDCKRAGNRHLEENDVAAAEGAFRRAIYLRPDDPDAHFGMARVLVRLGEKDEADGAIAHVLSLAPEHPAANGVRCVRALNRGDKIEARLRCAIAERGGMTLPPDAVAKRDALLR